MASRRALLVFAAALACACSGGGAPPPPDDPGSLNDFPDTAGLLDPTRRTLWNPGLNALGGVPARTAVCATLAPSGGDDRQAIQDAIDACPAEQVVQLLAGDFHLSSALVLAVDPNGKRGNPVTVRGAGPGTPGTGAGGTRLLMTGPGLAFLLGSACVGDKCFTDSEDLTASAPQGATQLTVAADPGYQVGELVVVDQLRPDYSWFAPGHAPADGTGPDGGWALFCRTGGRYGPGRTVGQVLEIASVQGTTLTFTTPLHEAYLRARQAQVSRLWDGWGPVPGAAVTTRVGVEDLYVEGAAGDGGGGILLNTCKACWVRNVELNRWVGGVVLMRSFRSEVRDSYIHSTRRPIFGGGGYALALSWYAADNLVENDIAWAVDKVIVAQSSGGGNVIGYNYFEDGYLWNAPGVPEVGMNASHYPTPHMELFEGNQAWDAESDVVWGNSVDLTFFRNHMTGRRRGLVKSFVDTADQVVTLAQPISDPYIRHAAGMGLYSWRFSFLGNVLGTPGDPLDPQATAVYEKSPDQMCDSTVAAAWMLGWGDGNGQCGAVQPAQADTAASVLRHGNWDFVTQGVVWEPSIARRDLPASLYLSAKPAFFGDRPWPWVTPDGGGALLGTLPARARFDAAHGAPEPRPQRR